MQITFEAISDTVEPWRNGKGQTRIIVAQERGSAKTGVMSLRNGFDVIPSNGETLPTLAPGERGLVTVSTIEQFGSVIRFKGVVVSETSYAADKPKAK